MYRNDVPANVRLIAKLVLLVLLGLLLMGILGVSLMALSGADGISKAEHISWCDEDYSDRAFGDLYDRMVLYDLQEDEAFRMYWEAVEGYRLSRESRQWLLAGEEETAQEMLQQLYAMAQTTEFPRNETLFQEFIAWTENQ